MWILWTVMPSYSRWQIQYVLMCFEDVWSSNLISVRMLAAVLMVDYTATPPLVLNKHKQNRINHKYASNWSDKPTLVHIFIGPWAFQKKLDSPGPLFISTWEVVTAGSPWLALAMGRFTPAPSHFSHSLQSLHLSDPTKSEEERSIVLWWPTSSWNDAAELIDHDISSVRFMGSFKQVVNT